MVDDYDDRFQKFRRKQLAKRESWMHKPSNDMILVTVSLIVVVVLWVVVWVLEK